MTYAEALEILKTYKMPMTAVQLETFKKALKLASGHGLRPPQ